MRHPANRWDCWRQMVLTLVSRESFLGIGILLTLGLGAGLAAAERDPWIGKQVFFKDNAVAKVGEKIVDKYQVLSFPAKVEAVNGDWLWLGRAWVRKTDVMEVDDAWKLFDQEVKSTPKNSKSWARRASSLMARGEYESAIKDYDEAIRLNPKSAMALNNRGMIKAERKDFAGAIADYNEAIKLDPKLAWAYNNRGVAKRNLKDIEGAIKDYNDAIRIDPKYATAFNNRGTAKGELKQHEAAIKDYEEAIRIDKKFAWPHNNLGIARRNLNDLKGSITAFDMAILLDPDYALAYRNRGDAKRDLQDLDGAQKDYEEAIRLDPKDAWPVFNRSIVRLMRRDQSAAQGFQQVIDLQGMKGDRSTFAVILGQLSARLTGNEETAQAFLKAAEGQISEEWPAPAVKYLRGEIDETAFIESATDSDKRTEAHCYLGLDKLARGDREAAMTHFQKVEKEGNKLFNEYTIAVAELKK